MKHFTLLLLLLCCSFSHSRSADSTMSIGGAVVFLRLPMRSSVGTILMLPGWNYSRTDCCVHSTFCDEALEAGYALVMPEMGKSIYLRTTYPQTRREWKQSPTLTWLVDSLIPSLQHSRKLFLPDDNNFLYGISTGARGGAMAAEATGSLFCAAALLSGDYDPTLDTNDRLMVGFLGSFSTFPERWSGENNPRASAARINIPMYIGHGEMDKVVPADQSFRFIETIRQLHPKIKSVLHLDTAGGHSYLYWGSETKKVIEFFDRNRKL